MFLKGKWVLFVTITSVFSCLLWMFGMGWALFDYFNCSAKSVAEAPAETVETDRNGIHIVALGDSLTRGTGDASGKGYVGYLMEDLEKRSDQKMQITNLGIKGQTSVQLAEQVKQQEVQRQIKLADTILITIGGNDLFRGGQTLAELDLQKVEGLKEEYSKNVDGILSSIRSQNTEANVFLIGLYNPFIDMEDANTTSQIVRDWNERSADISAKYPKAVFVPTFDLFQLKVEDYLYTDNFHPNSEGYQLIAERVAALLTW
ncbi:SGNH/GDSL hydrolase family protein [Domibacillus epiphyticus]|uniref:GDSL family lipase n=1 Tax=Domibacillus epiphyticus TaxID=1714355 RepID=A0A1V2A8P3_9BACI|nr:SGNH/GDSL hydrolase family protein [Domibacillus epiphyticus]OMP67368.1 GDSL family lipase [Domibacillus epiphyticus]